jgi:hypothetical protein
VKNKTRPSDHVRGAGGSGAGCAVETTRAKGFCEAAKGKKAAKGKEAAIAGRSETLH